MSFFKNGTYGDFDPLCQATPLAICSITSEDIDPTCVAIGVGSTTFILENIGTFVGDIFFAIVVILLAIREVRKLVLIGRKEFITFLFFYSFVCILEALLYGKVFVAVPSGIPYVVAIYVAALESMYWVLFFNSFVGFRWIEDGGKVSLGALASSVIVVFTVVFYITLDTGLDISGFFSPPKTSGLFTIYYIFPIICVSTYVVMQIILCTRVLHDPKPLAYLFASVVAFVGSQVLLIIFNTQICQKLEGYIDGIFFSTVLNFAAVCFLDLYFEASSEDEFDFDTV